MQPSESAVRPLHIHIEWEGDPAPPVPPQLPMRFEIALNACTAAVSSGLQGMMKAGEEHYADWQAGSLGTGEYVRRVAERGATEGVRGGARSAIALSMSEIARRQIVRRWGRIAAGRLGRYHVVSSVAYGVVDQGIHTWQLMRGQIDERQYKVSTAENLGATGGAISGAAAGAVIGSAVPGLGTAAGALIGMIASMMGAMSGASLGKSLAEQWFPPQEEDKTSGSA
jgi:hypothetical protein